MLEWEKLASEAGLQLPHWGTAFTTGAMERWLHRLGISTRDYLEWDGSRKLGDFARRNPDWLYREWAGLILEHRALMGGAP